jgi:glucose-1-phosphate thymidylyltransferase
MDASLFIATIQRRQGLKIACLEEIAYRLGYIDKEDVHKIALTMYQNSYGQYLLDLIDDSPS